MSARTARSKRATKSTAKMPKTDTQRFRVPGVGRRIVGWFSSIETPAGVRREVSALLALTVGVLLFVVLIQPSEGSLFGFLGSWMRALFGQGALLVPLAFFWLAGEALFA
jgi:hypothetical protein